MENQIVLAERFCGSFDLNRGEKRPSRTDEAGFLQSLRQGVFDGFPVGFGEVGLELEQRRNVFLTAGERRERKVKKMNILIPIT